MKRKLLFFIFVLTALSALYINTAFAADIKYVYEERTELTKGVSLTSYNIFMSDRNWNKAYVVEADLNYPHLSLEVLTGAGGVNYLSTVPDMAKNNDTTAAINSDFFNWSSRPGCGSPIGAVYFEKAMLSSPASSEGMYTIMQDQSGSVFADIIDYKMILSAPNGEQKQIAGKNKASDLSQIMMYDKYYDEYSLGSTETQYEVVVRNNIIEEIRFSSEPVRLEDNMYVLAALADWDTFLLDNFSIGDEIRLDVISSVDFDSLRLAAGAGAKLLTNGNIAESFSHVIGGTNPRSALGISQNKKTVYLAAVDGRSSDSNGMTMTEFAAFMRYIGAYEAVNLDGGGSTTLVSKDLQSGSQKLINTPSDGSLRKVAASIAVTSSVKSASSLYHLKLTADGENVFKNSRIKLFTEGFDEYYFPVNINTDEISYSVSGVEGYFADNTFFPTTSGTARITARMPNGATADIHLRVLDTPYKIEHEASTLNIDIGGAQDFWMFVRDERGYIAHVPLCDMTVNFSENIAHVEGTAVVGDTNGSALMSVKFGDAIIYAAVRVGSPSAQIPLPMDKTASDSLNKTGTSDSVGAVSRFAVFGSIRESDTLFNNLIMKQALGKINGSADMAFLLSTHPTANVSSNLSIPVKTCYPFNSFSENGNTYIVLDTEDNFMSAREWVWFVDEVNAANAKNLFVFMQTDLSFVSARETKLLKDVLSGAAERGINVFAFCNGTDTFSAPENGVRYIKTAGFSDDISPYGFALGKDKLKYVLVDIDSNNNVSYKFMPVY